jgi:formylglycine-generating enzyme required for sulfatase activity
LPATERARSALALARLGDPRREVTTIDDMEFSYIPADESRSQETRLGRPEDLHQSGVSKEARIIGYGYWIARFPISNAQFSCFVEADGYKRSSFWREAEALGVWEKGNISIVPHAVKEDGEERNVTTRSGPPHRKWPTSASNAPVVGVNWYEALAFCHWLTKLFISKGWLSSGWQVVMPSIMEWEKAARGGVWIPAEPSNMAVDRGLVPKEFGDWLVENPQRFRLFPWGDRPDTERANYDATGLQHVCSIGCFPEGASPYGVEDLSGNAWEWTRTAVTSLAALERGEMPMVQEELMFPPHFRRFSHGGQLRLPAERIRCSSRWEWDSLVSDAATSIRVAIIPSS